MILENFQGDQFLFSDASKSRANKKTSYLQSLRSVVGVSCFLKSYLMEIN